MVRSVLSLLLSLLLVGGAFAQQPVFRAGTRLVTVDVAVTNNKGSVRGLTKDDFTLLDKGKAQTISLFVANESGAEGAKAQPLPANVASNRITRTGEASHTPTIVLFDRMNTPSSDQAIVRGKVLAALTGLKATDRVAFYSLGETLMQVTGFDEDASKLAKSAQRVIASAKSDGADAELDAKLKNATTPMQSYAVDVRAQVLWTALQSIALNVSGVPGRKSLIWVASSFPLIYGESAERRTNYDSDLARATRILGESDIALFPMDPRPITSAAATSATSGSTSKGGGSKGGRGGGGGGGGDPVEASAMPGRIDANPTIGAPVGLSGNETMQALASGTGGKAYYNSNDVGVDIHKVLEEAQTSYTLGFYVDEKSLDGKQHDLNIKVANKPETKGTTLHFRKHYYAIAPGGAAGIYPMAELVADPLDASAIGLMGASGPDPNKPNVHLLQVRVDVADLTFVRQGDRWHADFELGTSARLKDDKTDGPINTKPMALNLTDDQYKQGLASGVIIDNSLPSPTKSGMIRVVVQDKLGGRVGSIRVPVNPR